MTSKYQNNKSVAKNPTVSIDADDPRVSWENLKQTQSRIGSEIEIIGGEGRPVLFGGDFSGAVITDKNVIPPSFPANITWPGDNQPPKTYPGGSGPFIIVPTDPANVTATWSGDDLVVTFDWDANNEYNVTITQFILEVTADGVTRRTPMNTFVPNKSSTSQTAVFTKTLNKTTFGLFRTKITSVCVLVADPLNNISQTICAATVGTYVLNLPVPVITVSSISNGYSVAYTTPTEGPFDSLDVWEIESTATTAPTVIFASDGITPTNYKRSYFSNLNPANVITPNYNKRWIMARFSSEGGVYTLFCSPEVVTPTSPISIDNSPPNEVTQIVATWVTDNISIAYKLPAQDQASRVQLELTAPNSLVGYFYRFPDGSGRDQTTVITKKDLFDQFGEHYGSFAGIFRSIDAADNRSSGVSFTVAQRPNPLDTVVPTFTTLPLSNAYSVNFTLPAGAVFSEVYAKHTPWTTNPTDSTYLVYAGLSPAVIVDTDYTTTYIKIRYYDDFGNTSGYSEEGTVTPANPGEITSFENPISFGENAVIYAGGSPTTGNRVTFKTSGIFAYDSTNSAPTTQIISNASAGTPTFITTQAQIADWNITDTKIENTLAGTPTSYTGLSATGNYSFWSGSDTTGGDANANFYITSTGQVQSKNINIVGSGSKPVTATINGTTATYTSTVDHKFMVGQTVKISNMIPVGYNVTADIVSVPTSKTFTVSNVTATGSGSGGVASTSLLSAGGVFNVFNDGSMSASSADITGKITASSGSFTGNVSIGTTGSLYAIGSGGTASSGIRTIFNKDGVSAYNSSGGYAQMLTSPLADGSVFATTAANIGGWSVDSSKIQKTSISGKGNIILDSTNGYIAVSNSDIASSLAGINSPGNNLNHSVFWAGTTDPNSTSNPFRVTIGGKLFSTSAEITGTISSVGALGRMSMDGTEGYISLKTGASGPTSYLVPRNNNIYLTSPSTTEPWSTGTQIASSGPVSGPYISAGSSYKDYWGNVTTGTGIFVGAWDYFTTGSSKPFVTATDTGIQLSVSPDLGLLLDRGDLTRTGDKLNPAIPSGTPSMLFYTSKQSGTPYSPTTAYGAWASFTNKKIKLSADSNTFINITGTDGTADENQVLIKATTDIGAVFNSDGILIRIDTDTYQEFNNNYIKLQAVGTVSQTLNTDGILIQSTADVWQKFTSSGIRLQATSTVYQEINSSSITLTSGLTIGANASAGAYGGLSKIIIDQVGVNITGIPRAATFDMQDYRSIPPFYIHPDTGQQMGYYRSTAPLGYVPRQRAVIEDPVSGRAELGFAIYYMDLAKINIGETDLPSNTMGVQGDLAVMF